MAELAQAALVAANPAARRAAPSRDWLPIAAGSAMVMVLQLYLVRTKSINWDEFFFFSRIEELHDGRLAAAMQTSYTRVFQFLRVLPGDAIDQLLIGRTIMLACELVVAGAIFAIASHFTNRRAAALCALTYLTAGYVFLHGFAFRADPLATALLMSALWIFCRRTIDRTNVAIIALLLALAVMVTVKAIFYAPAFLGVAYLRHRCDGPDGRFVIRSVEIVGLAALVFAGLFWLHASGLAPVPMGPRENGLVSAWQTVFSAGILPQSNFLSRQAMIAPHVTVMLAVAPFLWARRFADLGERVAMFGLWLPLVTLLFYRNSYPYFYVFILAPAVIATIPAIELAVRRFGIHMYVVFLIGIAAILTLIEPRHVLPVQRTVAEGVREIFPHRVSYFDFSGVVGDYPRALSFLTSGWGLKRYRLAGEPLLTRMMAEQPIPLLIVNHSVIAAALAGREQPETFLPRDVHSLHDNYIPHWGPVWVAGKQIAAGSKQVTIQIGVPGTYTLEKGKIGLDGRVFHPGDTVYLARGRHRVVPNSDVGATLRWGKHLTVPLRTGPEVYPFTDY